MSNGTGDSQQFTIIHQEPGKFPAFLRLAFVHWVSCGVVLENV